MFMKRLLLQCVLISLGTVQVIAQEASTWIGQKVVAKYHYPIKSGDLLVEKQNRFHVYTVERTNGDRLLVVSGSVQGWIPASQVVLFDKAIDFYTQEIAANPGKSVAWSERGIIWNDKEESDKAIDAFNESIRLNPKIAAAYTYRGTAWLAMGEYDKAIADFNETSRLEPTYALAYSKRGIAWAKKEAELRRLRMWWRDEPKNPAGRVRNALSSDQRYG
jgi:tetratricopeptide (TPR) repeat protein